MLTAKFIRAHAIPTLTTGQGFAWFFRLLYEFWGFCVNGDVSLTTPGSASFAPVSGVFGMPTAFATTGTLASGSDGFTTVGMPFFNSLSATAFSSSYVNKHLVVWQSGSPSTDDSVYQITQWINSSSVRVNVLQGGTPYTGSLHPSFTTRSSINWRLVDFQAAAGLTYASTSSLVLQLSDAGNVNPLQPSPHVRLRRATGPLQVGVTMSPSGSWGLYSGSYGFSDPTTELLPGGWFGGNESPAYVSVFAAGDFIIAHYKSTNDARSSGFHVEVPQRLYPQGTDPNPVTGMTWSSLVPSLLDASNHYGGGFYMHNPPDNTTLQYFGASRRFDGLDTSTLANATNGPVNGAYYNTYQNKFLFSDVVLQNPTVQSQYQLARVRLRRVRVLPPIVPQFERVGNSGEWLHVVNGVMWPWDNSILPYNLFLGGN